MSLLLAILPILSALIPFVIGLYSKKQAADATPENRFLTQQDENDKAIVTGKAANLLNDRLCQLQGNKRG